IYNFLNAGKSGIQKPPGEKTTIENCFRKKPQASLSNGEQITLEGIPMCGVSFKRLSWREIKTDFIN
ncbi:hypothetical protein J3U68_10615, partial [Snodgrassella sp. B3882]|uniref:hypothetical protein n=1 Tax=Snodgrassella sp. B3882 TaxID=2818037 RepID=UPI00226A3B1A